MAKRTTIQITCTPELQKDAADLALSYGLDVVAFWRPIIEEYIELNREQIEKFRACMDELKKNQIKKPASKKTAPKKKKAPTAQVMEDKAGDDNV